MLEAREINKSIKNSLGDTPSVVIWNPVPANDQEREILSMLKYEDNLKSFSDKLGSLVDYVIIDESIESEEKSVLRDFGLKVLEEDLKGIDSKIPESIKNLLDTLSNILKTPLEFDESILPNADEEVAIPASKLLEPEEEKGLDKIVAVDLDEGSDPTNGGTEIENEEDGQAEEVKEESPELANRIEKNDQEEPVDHISEEEEVVAEQVPEKKRVYDPGMNETWEDALKGAIDDAIINNNQDAIDWIKYTCGKDDTLQVTMAEDVIKTLFESDMALRNNVINLMKQLYDTTAEAFNQVYSMLLLNTISEKNMERRREVVQMYVTLQSDLMEFCEKLLNSVIKDLTQKREDDLLGMELSKLTLIQMVVGSRRLKKRAIRVILTLLDLRPDSNYLWNFLLPFDAGSVALELITQFSITKSEEIIRKSIILRYTDTYLTTLQSVINYWKEGDRNSIVNITGLILPDDTIRKLERMELAQQIKKLKLVPLTTLAELVDKDSKQIEVMVSELSLKDGLNIQMKVIDDRMVVTYEENQNPE